MTYIQIGNMTISALWLAVFFGLSTAYLFHRFILRKPVLDWYWNAFFLYFIIWKFSYILFEFPMFLKTPLSLLYFSGGTLGHILAIIIITIDLLFRVKRKDPTLKNEGLNILILFFISFEFFYHLLEQHLFIIYAEVLLVILGVAIHFIWKRQGKQYGKVILYLLFFGQLVIKIMFQNFFTISTGTFSFLAIVFFFIFESKEKRNEIWNVKQFRLPFLALLTFSIFFLLLQPSFPEGGTKAEGNTSEKATVGYVAPEFELTTLDGETVRLSDYRGKKVIINFWASWCPPCKSEMPHMQAFYEEQNQNEIEILAVNATKKDDGIDQVKQFVTDYGLTFPIPLDVEGKVEKKYLAVSTPTSYFIDTNGIIREKIVGPMDKETMEKIIKQME